MADNNVPLDYSPGMLEVDDVFHHDMTQCNKSSKDPVLQWDLPCSLAYSITFRTRLPWQLLLVVRQAPMSMLHLSTKRSKVFMLSK
jgi:hypothetical protein